MITVFVFNDTASTVIYPYLPPLSLHEPLPISPAQAFRHPNCSMGAKISVDRATMMNKGLELIEAHHLFPVGLDRIAIMVHPQSVIHSLVEFRDHSTLAQLGAPDMRIPIAHALAWPERIATSCAPLDLVSIDRKSTRLNSSH